MEYDDDVVGTLLRSVGDLPKFKLQAKDVVVLNNPSEFTSHLLGMISAAQERVVLASLYLGTGSIEQNLVEILLAACDRRPGLDINILLDYTRSTRGRINSITVLQPLLHKSQSAVISLYHTPRLRGALRAVLPQKSNEIIGVSHIKGYLVDDCIIISGANLSHDYFTNRQDRYILVRSRALCSFFQALVRVFGKHAFTQLCSGTLSPPSVHPYKDSRAVFAAALHSDLMNLLRSHITSASPGSCSGQGSTPAHCSTPPRGEDQTCSPADTWIVPLLQLKDADMDCDEIFTSVLLQNASVHDRVSMATAYFNLSPRYQRDILNSPSTFRILLPHPMANGFYNGNFPLGYVPLLYSEIARMFTNRVIKHGRGRQVHLTEYYRPGWTFHGKGIWFYRYQQAHPYLTVVGSSNFGLRSTDRDVELNFALETKDPGLREAFGKEESQLFSYGVSAPIQPHMAGCDRTPVIVRVLLPVLRSLL